MMDEDEQLVLSLADAIDVVQGVIGDWGDGGLYTEPVRLRVIFAEKLGLMVKELRERATASVCFCCRRSCQEGCSCYEHSPDKIKDDEYMAQLEVRMAAAGVPTGTLYAESNAYGLYSKATELWYPETDEQRRRCLEDGRPVAP